MKLDITQDSDKEIQIVMGKLVATGYDQIDESALERKVKFDGVKKTIYLAFYPELLTYDNKITPWICVELQDNEDISDEEYCREIAKFITNEFKKIDINLFMDEDAFMQHFKKDTYGLKCYFNLDYPEGYWQNHTL